MWLRRLRHIWLRQTRLRHMVMPHVVMPVTPNSVTSHGYTTRAGCEKIWKILFHLHFSKFTEMLTHCHSPLPTALTVTHNHSPSLTVTPSHTVTPSPTTLTVTHRHSPSPTITHCHSPSLSVTLSLRHPCARSVDNARAAGTDPAVVLTVLFQRGWRRRSGTLNNLLSYLRTYLLT